MKSLTLMMMTAVLAACAAPPGGLSPAQASVPQGARVESCKAISEQEVAALFERWNRALLTRDPHQVAALYAKRSILLPTVSNQARLTAAEKEDYFHHFLESQPSGKVDLRRVEIGCNMVVDAGLYTFSFAKTGAMVSGRYSFTYGWTGADWLITSHHSSAMPEKK
jgi:uncharacterized protein (TIGR02246 family)